MAGLGLAGAIFGAALASHAAPGKPSGSCLPADLAVRVQVEEPAVLAGRVAALLRARKPGARHRALREQLEEAGCERVEERAAQRLRRPNLVCLLPGRTSETIVISASPERDGIPAAAMLAALAKALRAEPRERTYQVAAFARDRNGAAGGAWEFAESLAGEPAPILALHLGFVGYGDLRIEMDSDPALGCGLKAVAARMKVDLTESSAEPQTLALAGTEKLPGFGQIMMNVIPLEGLADRFAFLGNDIRFAGVTSDFRERASFDAVAHYQAYQFLAAYLVIADATLTR